MRIRGRLRIRTRLRSFAYRIWPPKPKPLILMYHRIADDPIDHWGLSVSPVRFEEHLHVLRRTRHPLPLAEFVSDLKAGTLRPNAVALTFDDGYVDNLTFAKPRLAAADVPATVFLATGYLNRPDEFWWDELARLILLERGPRSFEVTVRGETLHLELDSEPITLDNGPWGEAQLTGRRAVLRTIWRTLRGLNEEEREPIMARLRSLLSPRDVHTNRGRSMTHAEVRRLVTDGLVTVGAHTVTHPVLSQLDANACYREVAESKFACEAIIDAAVPAFAYPHGAFDPKARGMVEAAGFTFACSTRYGPSVGTCDVFALPRIYAGNWNGDDFEQALRFASVGIRTNFSPNARRLVSPAARSIDS